MTERIGFIGLGAMGEGMARNILKSGLSLAITTSDPVKGKTFGDLGAAVVATPADLAAIAPIVVTCVPDAAALNAVLTGPGGLLINGWSNGLLIDCSTIAPFEAQDIATALSQADAALVDAPVSGGRTGAQAGTLTIMCGGQNADITRAQPVLQAMGKTIHHMGPTGAGQAVKACNQLMVAINLMGAVEAVGLARAAGVDPRHMREVLMTGAARSGVLEAHALRYLDGALSPGFRGDLLNKDLGIATAMATRSGQHQPATALAHKMVDGACDAGFGSHDSAALGLFYDQLNGVVDAKDAP